MMHLNVLLISRSTMYEAMHTKDYDQIRKILYNKKEVKELAKYKSMEMVRYMVDINDYKLSEIMCKHFATVTGQGEHITEMLKNIISIVIVNTYIDRMETIKMYIDLFPIPARFKNQEDEYLYRYEYILIDTILDKSENYNTFMEYYNKLLLPMCHLIPSNCLYEREYKYNKFIILKNDRLSMINNFKYYNKITKDKSVMDILFHNANIPLIVEYLLDNGVGSSEYNRTYFYERLIENWCAEDIGDLIVSVIHRILYRGGNEHYKIGYIVGSLERIYVELRFDLLLVILKSNSPCLSINPCVFPVWNTNKNI